MTGQAKTILFASLLLPLAILCHAGVSATDPAPPVEAPAPAPLPAVFLMAGPWLGNVTPDGVTIRWITSIPLYPPVVSTMPGNREYTGISRRIKLKDRFLGMGRRFVWFNSVTLDGLNPGARHDYTIKGCGAGGSFNTPPAGDGPFTFAVYGDSRGSAPWQSENHDHESVIAAIAGSAPDFFINTGDMVFSGDSDHDWQLFLSNIKAIAPAAPLYPVYGNHEARGAEEAVKRWSAIFALPGRGATSMYYSFRYGGLLFLVLCSSCGLEPGSVQVEWARLELEKAAKDPSVKFMAAVFHNPMYTCGPHRDDERAREGLEPLLLKYGVKLVLTGHNHHYEHLVANGVHHMTLGGGGAPLTEAKTACRHRPLKSETLLHYALISVKPGSIDVRVLDTTGAQIDAFEIR